MQYGKTIGCANIWIDTKRIDDNIARAQNLLDQRVIGDMLPYMPIQQGELTGNTKIVEPGLITTNTPYAHYQYMGELYLTSDGRSYAHYGEKKYPTGKPLHYYKPLTGDHWFEKAKQVHGREWVDLVKREAGRE